VSLQRERLLLEIPFPWYFFLFEPLNCILIPILYFASPFTSFKLLFFHFLTGLKSCYKCAFDASGQGGGLPLEGVELKLACGFYRWPLSFFT
jgi:hypothetical protein